MSKRLLKRNNTYSVYLKDGNVCIMEGTSFQKQLLHCVPKYPSVKSWRLNITFRTGKKVSIGLKKDILKDFVEHKIIDGASLCLGSLDNDILSPFKKELVEQIKIHGKPDQTKIPFKNEYTMNNGRMVLDMAFKEGMTYTYGGKTTAPGIAFGPSAQGVLKIISELIGVVVEDIWAHVVFYPNGECGLGWHSDAEDGLDPARIVSLTFLEDPIGGVRRFQVKPKNKKPDLEGARKKLK